MSLKYKSLKELYSLTELTIYQIARRIHRSPHTIRRWKSIEDVPESLLYKIENLAIYKRNRKNNDKELVTKITVRLHKIS